MARTNWKNAPTIRTVYRSDVQGKILRGEVVAETKKTITVRDVDAWGWVKREGREFNRWCDSKSEALDARLADLNSRIERSKSELAQQRTWLGMVEGEKKRLDESESVGAVAGHSVVSTD